MKAIFQTTILVLLFATGVTADILPTAAEVKSVTIKCHHPKLDDAEFEATAGDWGEIRSHLLPADDDPKPSKWIGLGDVTIVKKDGRSIQIAIYKTSSGPGAFSIGKDYYRGGDSSKLMKAILKAFEKSKPLTPKAKDVR
jgi:hypothetical protein